MFAIVYKENGKAIGSLGIHESWANQEEEYKDLRVKEIGYSLSRDYWGRGLVPEAAQKVIDHFFFKKTCSTLSPPTISPSTTNSAGSSKNAGLGF